ncbi:hypothetical protein FHS52_001101 [Erythromicrobium ramosum]|uniref:Uncharacterized protein n=1 Tax=Erythrobacter ramosus TaxID=35811 RepID=A0A6I4UH70_9SPHN|nr:hypothetical protein [Erythrobacter ramosus]MBB3775158.1 hypothetical protein [Erythrobacter ramosus]MXP37214.1 hypothetical protein [Erythrobacter ramosus]
MKAGTHNLGSNAFSQMTLAKLDSGKLVIRQSKPAGLHEITLSADQIALLKDVLA